MKDEYTYTQLAPPPPKVKARALSLKIFTISQVSELPLYLISKACNGLKKYSKYDV